jgi:hypothetical protein
MHAGVNMALPKGRPCERPHTSVVIFIGDCAIIF